MDSVFEQFHSRKRKEREAIEQQDCAVKEVAKKAARILSSVALPVLKEISADIQRRGHRSEVREMLGDIYHPSIRIDFTIVTWESAGTSPTSRLDFVLND